MKFVEVMAACENASGKGSKQIIQEELARLDAPGRKLVRYALDPYKVFGVKKYGKIPEYAEQDPEHIDFVFEVLDALASRKITGDAARAEVVNMLAQFTEYSAGFVAGVIDKTLRAGFSADTFNKVWPTEPIPTFEVMLADKCEEVSDFEKYVTFPCQADIKYDGTRTIAIVRAGQFVEYRARSGKPSNHLNGLFDDEMLAIRDILGYDFVLDGETFGANFTETMNAKGSDNIEAKEKLKFLAFFLMPLTDWVAQSTNITMRQNRDTLLSLLTNGDKVIISGGKEVQNFQEMTEYCNHVIDDLKQEGLILKDWNAVYCWDRSFAWTKVKRFYDVDARIIDFYAGKKGSRLANTIGGVICGAYLESGLYVQFKVGSGFTDADRESLKNNQDEWRKKTLVISYQDVTKGKGNEHASLRFCTFVRTRDDKTVEL